MNFLIVLFFVLGGSFSIIHTNILHADYDTKNQYTHIKAIIFDCDGTLIDNGIGYFLDWQYALRCQGYELNADEFSGFMNRNKLIGHPGADETIVQYCCELVGRECAHEILKDKKIFSAKLQQTYEFPAIEPTINFLHALGKEKKNLDLKVGLASANSKENIMRILKRLNIDQYFDVIVSGEDLALYSDPEGTNKPKPYIYLEAAKLLGIHPEQCVAIEDSHTGISSAINAGCIAVAIPNTYTDKQDLSNAHLKLISLENIIPIDFLQMIKYNVDSRQRIPDSGNVRNAHAHSHDF